MPSEFVPLRECRRDRAILLTLLDSGVRCAEAVQLDLTDCELARRRLHIRHGKGDKARVVPFAGRCGDALTAYIADRGMAPGPLFVAARYERLNAGVRLRPNGLKQLLRDSTSGNAMVSECSCLSTVTLKLVGNTSLQRLPR